MTPAPPSFFPPATPLLAAGFLAGGVAALPFLAAGFAAAAAFLAGVAARLRLAPPAPGATPEAAGLVRNPTSLATSSSFLPPRSRQQTESMSLSSSSVRLPKKASRLATSAPSASAEKA